MVEDISTGEFFLVIGVVALMCITLGRRFLHVRRRDQRTDALVYDAKHLKALSEAREGKYASHQEICGVLVGPGEEIEALEGELDFLDNVCESEQEFKAGVEQLPYFIGPAKRQLDKLCSAQVNDDDYGFEELAEIIEEAEVAIAEAEWIVANPCDALVQWEEET